MIVILVSALFKAFGQFDDPALRRVMWRGLGYAAVLFAILLALCWWGLSALTFFDIGSGKEWFDDAENARIVRRVAEKCYLPMNAQMLEQIERHGERFRISYSISGAALDQFERWVPEAIESFQKLAATGCVEFLGETSHHSLAALASRIDP